MCSVELLRVSVQERIDAAAEDFLLQVEKGAEPERVPALRALLTERLTAAAAEIVALFEETVAEYEVRVERSEREVSRQRRLLDVLLKPRVRLHTADAQQQLKIKEEVPHVEPWAPPVDLEEQELPDIKEEEVWTNQEAADIITVTVKGEDDDEKPGSSQDLYRSEEKTRGPGGPEPDGGPGGPEPDGGPGGPEPDGGPGPGTDDEAEDSAETEDSDVGWAESREAEEEKGLRSVENFSCSVCGKRFGRGNDLRRHMKGHTGEKPFSCSECGKRFIQKSDLKRHENSHTGEKPFSCSVCGRSFGRKSSVRIHEVIHSGARPFSCLVCGKSFNLKPSLQLHLRIHTGEKPFSCPVCGKRFSQKSDLRRHEKSHTGERPFSCSVCGKRFGHRSNLRVHEKTHSRKNLTEQRGETLVDV